jgi:hypothetical protein
MLWRALICQVPSVITLARYSVDIGARNMDNKRGALGGIEKHPKRELGLGFHDIHSFYLVMLGGRCSCGFSKISMSGEPTTEYIH